MDAYFTTIGQVASCAEEYYKKHRNPLDFVDILFLFFQKGMLASQPRPFHHNSVFLSPEEFRCQGYSLAVNAGPLLSNTSNTSYEDCIIPSFKDISTFIHVPYLSGKMHQHDYFEINYAYTGSFTQIFAQEQRHFNTGSLVLIAPGSPHIVNVDENSLIICINIRRSTFDKIFWPLLNTDDPLSLFFKHSLFGNNTRNYLSFQIEQTLEYERIIQQIFNETNINDPYSNNMAISEVNLLFGRLLREFGHNIQLYDPDYAVSFRSDFPLIMKYVQYNYANVSLPVLSRMFHYSEVYISKMFKQNLNKNFSAVVQSLRLFHARQYLQTTDYTLKKIAEIVGYESADYLSRIFKKTYHMTPSQYRQTAEDCYE